jgi:hypothetical protein
MLCRFIFSMTHSQVTSAFLNVSYLGKFQVQSQLSVSFLNMAITSLTDWTNTKKSNASVKGHSDITHSKQSICQTLCLPPLKASQFSWPAILADKAGTRETNRLRYYRSATVITPHTRFHPFVFGPFFRYIRSSHFGTNLPSF